jgi:hypothetical protein
VSCELSRRDLQRIEETSARFMADSRGHDIPRFSWDRDGLEAAGTCTRCGDGIIISVGPDEPAIHGTAIDSDCPGSGCEHGWSIERRDGSGTRLLCLHCGAVRAET